MTEIVMSRRLDIEVERWSAFIFANRPDNTVGFVLPMHTGKWRQDVHLWHIAPTIAGGVVEQGSGPTSGYHDGNQPQSGCDLFPSYNRPAISISDSAEEYHHPNNFFLEIWEMKIFTTKFKTRKIKCVAFAVSGSRIFCCCQKERTLRWFYFFYADCTIFNYCGAAAQNESRRTELQSSRLVKRVN